MIKLQAQNCPPPRKLRIISAFTLAEVLITLGIIGVVAAMTIPNIVANYQKKVTVEQLKAAYNIFSNAIAQAEEDYLSPIIVPSDIGNYTTKMSALYFEPYIKGISPYPKKVIIVKCPDKKTRALGFSGGSYEDPKCLANGICYKMYRHATGYITLYIDLNGPKGPNIMGRDNFIFDMTAPYSTKCVYGGGYHCIVAPHPYVEGSWSAFGRTIDGNCSKNSDGSTCASKIILDGWQIAPDYPW